MCAETGLLQQLNKMRARTAQNVHQLSQLFLKVVLQGTICNNEFWRNTALQHCCNTVSMVAKLFQHCNAVLCWKSSLQIVLCNIIFNRKSSLLYVMTIKTAVVVESVQLIITEANKLAILQVWLRVWTQDNWEQIQQVARVQQADLTQPRCLIKIKIWIIKIWAQPIFRLISLQGLIFHYGDP